jgi:hypothetical protein
MRFTSESLVMLLLMSTRSDTVVVFSVKGTALQSPADVGDVGMDADVDADEDLSVDPSVNDGENPKGLICLEISE